MQSSLADTIDEHIVRLDALRKLAIVKELHPDQLDPDHLRQLAELETEVCYAQDEIHYAIAVAGGLAETAGQRRDHRFMVSDMLLGNLSFELRDKADQIEQFAEAAE